MPLNNSLSFLSDLSDAQVESVAKFAEEASHKKGDAIFANGEPGDCCYLVLEGAVRINAMIAEDVEETLVTVRQGAVFGELALITGDSRNANAVAIEDCQLAIIKAADFATLIGAEAEIGRRLLQKLCQTLSERLQNTTRQYARAVAWGIHVSDVVGLNFDTLIASQRELRIRLLNSDTVSGTLLRVESGNHTELLLRDDAGAYTIVPYAAIAAITFAESATNG
jgi:CRP-like cAMP-binding protein